ncbi:MAG: DUF1761 domain-containing protein [Flavobacteriales bacterium]|nr:DUF1761 domain-containing protein [Flavobacteriales bacterium]
MDINIISVIGAAFVPLVMGFIWYNPKVLGNAWMEAAGMTEEKMKGANMAMIFGISFVLSFLLAFEMNFIAVHQNHVPSILMNTPGFGEAGSEIQVYFDDFMARFGNNFRTFKHGALHGTVAGFLLALPILGTNALFERKSFKYIAINAGYWIITMALMGGVVCQKW